MNAPEFHFHDIRKMATEGSPKVGDNPQPKPMAAINPPLRNIYNLTLCMWIQRNYARLLEIHRKG